MYTNSIFTYRSQNDLLYFTTRKALELSYDTDFKCFTIIDAGG